MEIEALANNIERFAERMRAIWLDFRDDEEACHKKMDDLMCETLTRINIMRERVW